MDNDYLLVEENVSKKHLLVTSLLGGAMAGMVVDVVLFPLDTLKTRLQAAKGFQKSGGFKHIYKGIGPQMAGSGPQSALFFLTYEFFKHTAVPMVEPKYEPVVYLIGGSLSEFVACILRVPMEVVKQRRQTSKYKTMQIVRHTYKHEGFRGFYRGFGSTILRELPFAAIQLPALELLMRSYRRNFKNNISLESQEVAVCGAFAGAIAAAVTTPLDVVKTRIMLAKQKDLDERSIRLVIRKILQTQGIRGLFAGFVPRTLWIGLGGFIFFGTYDFAKSCSSEALDRFFNIPRYL